MRKVAGYFFAVITVVCVLGIFYVRFTHAELTETQMLIELWPQFGMLGLGAVVSVGLSRFMLEGNVW